MEVQRLVAYNLRRIRVLRKISQDDQALIADIERAYVGHLERASRNPTIVTLEKLAQALDCPIAELFLPVPEEASSPQTLRRGRKKANIGSVQ